MLQLEVCTKRVCQTLGWAESTILGPSCLTLAFTLISVETICFFDVIAPSLPYPTITIPICLIVLLNLCMHYFYALTISPGFLDDPPRESFLLWDPKPKLDKEEKSIASWSEKGVKITTASTTECRKCNKIRPERSHHCRLCKKCVLKYDHHCPWINQCVGLHNERHFILFIVYVVISTIVIIKTGFGDFIAVIIRSSGIAYGKWDHNFPENWYAQVYIVNIAVFLGAALLLGVNLYNIIYGETTGEGIDNVDYREEAEARNEEFINSYDCGKLKNLQLFFNIGDGYSVLALFLPLRVNPYTDGFSWARRDGFEDYPSFREAKQPKEKTIIRKLYNYLSF